MGQGGIWRAVLCSRTEGETGRAPVILKRASCRDVTWHAFTVDPGLMVNGSGASRASSELALSRVSLPWVSGRKHRAVLAGVSKEEAAAAASPAAPQRASSGRWRQG